MDQAKRIAIAKSQIALAAQSEEEVYEIINGLLQEDWSKLMTCSLQYRRIELPCVICKCISTFSNTPLSGICFQCWPEYHCKVSELSNQLIRARKNNLPATLTLRGWYQTIDDFQGRCAYCLIKNKEVMEHFIPITLGGGTTKYNCVPACYKCNGKKGNHHPNEVAHLYLEGTIERVQAYLYQFAEIGTQTP